MKYFRRHPDLLLIANCPEAGTIARILSPGKKILLLTDHIIPKLIYNHETHTICILYHPGLFGRFWTDLVTPVLIAILRLCGKRVITVFLRARKMPIHTIIAALATRTLTIPRKFRSRKERRVVGNKLYEELFPSPIKNLGLAHYLG